MRLLSFQKNYMNPLFLFLFLFVFGWGVSLNAQVPIDWNILADAEWKEQWDEEIQAYWLVPEFGDRLRTYEGKEIEIRGYFMPINEEEGFFVLSKNPWASCFFCGMAGPETIIELQMEDPREHRFKMDQRLVFRGILQLNNTDFMHCNYILTEATPVLSK